MYVPPAFAVDDRAWALDAIARYPFGLLVTHGDDFPLITHLPMMALEREDRTIVIGHVARANPHAAAILAGERATAVFEGAHAYVSASWYEQPYETVPTWNYTAVHAVGRLAPVDPREVLDRLTAAFEDGREHPWRLDGLEPRYYEQQARGILAFEMPVERLITKAKLSQNRTDADRLRVIAALSESPEPLDRDCANAMREAMQ